jgi:hypothetical protein
MPDTKGGAIDDTAIGATTASTGAFTTLSSTGTSTIGNAASDLISFHGASAVDQAGFIATISYTFIEGSVSASALVGFSRGQVSNMLTLLNGIQAALVEKGLMASA